MSDVAGGFTLIEVLIYSALVSMMIGGALIAVYQVIESSDKVFKKIVVEEEANFVLRKLSWAMSGVDAINIPTPGSTSSTLSVNKTNFSENPVVFDLNAGNVRLRRGSGSASVLNSQNVTISNLTFEHVAPTGGKPAAIKVSFVIDGRTASTTIYLRK